MEIPEIPEGKKPYYFPRRTILLVGGTGLVGRSVYKKFESEGHTIKMLSTNREYVDSHNLAYYWNVEEGIIDEKAIEGVEVIVNLAGAGIADKLWTEERKKLIYSSRVEGTKLLYETCKKLNHKFIYYVGASASGFYGPNNSYIPKFEEDPRGEGFLADVCADWEREHLKFKSLVEVHVITRLPLVLSANGGFMLPFFLLSKFGFRVIMGKNRFYVSWIHIEDVSRFISAVLMMDIHGIFNLTVGFTSWDELQKTIYDMIGDQLVRITIPNWILRKTLKEMSTLFLDTNFCSGNKTEKYSFIMKHVELDETLFEIAKVRFMKEANIAIDDP